MLSLLDREGIRVIARIIESARASSFNSRIKLYFGLKSEQDLINV